MIIRCYNSKSQSYPWYGARGIIVCKRWHDSFENFLADVGLKPSPKHTLERRDVNGNYEPGNVEWATFAEQGANKRNNRLLTSGGVTLHMQEWCRRLNMNQRTLWDRLDTGWTEEEALTTPVGQRRKKTKK